MSDKRNLFASDDEDSSGDEVQAGQRAVEIRDPKGKSMMIQKNFLMKIFRSTFITSKSLEIGLKRWKNVCLEMEYGTSIIP